MLYRYPVLTDFRVWESPFVQGLVCGALAVLTVQLLLAQLLTGQSARQRAVTGQFRPLTKQLTRTTLPHRYRDLFNFYCCSAAHDPAAYRLVRQRKLRLHSRQQKFTAPQV
jgi:hypothetical protein